MVENENPGMTTGRIATTIGWIVIYAGGILAVLLLAWYGYGLIPRGDEAPIRVKNGSVDICLETGRWDQEADEDRWTPSKGDGDALLDIEVVATKGSCKGTTKLKGKKVDVLYSRGGGVSFWNRRHGLNRWRPRAYSLGALAMDTNKPNQLKYGNNANDFINEIVVKGGQDPWTCSFDEKDDDLRIYIGPRRTSNACP